MTIRFETASVDHPNFNPREYVERMVSRALPSVKNAFAPLGSLRPTTNITVDKAGQTVTATVTDL